MTKGDLSGATRAYSDLLERDPAAPAPSAAAPKIREAFRAAKVALFPMGTVKLTRVPAPEGHLSFELLDPWGAVLTVNVYESRRRWAASGCSRLCAPRPAPQPRPVTGCASTRLATRVSLEPNIASPDECRQAMPSYLSAATWADQLGLTIDHPSRIDGYWVEVIGEQGVLITLGSAVERLLRRSRVMLRWWLGGAWFTRPRPGLSSTAGGCRWRSLELP